MQKLIKERLAAQHLLYVSLKYTKTCDVILNLIQRWQNMVESAIYLLLERAKSKRVISNIPTAPKPRVELLEKLFKKEENVKETLALYSFFRRIPSAELIREHEFRKNVTLKVVMENETAIDLEKLKEWNELLEKFYNFVKDYVGKLQ